MLTGVGSLAAASVVSGGIGLAGAALMLAFVPETLTRNRDRIAARFADIGPPHQPALLEMP